MSGHRNVIAAAANIADCFNENGELVKSIVLVDSCHFGRNMRQMYELLNEIYHKVKTRGDQQGFVNYCGEYYTRADAYKIAKASGQPFNDEFTLYSASGVPKLDSSCIRHFNEDTTWDHYMCK